jgi:phosphatidylglycerophosphate synthase
MTRFSDPQKVFSYSYQCRDSSLLLPYFRRYVSQQLLKVIPRTCAPNLLSLLANLISILVFAVVIGVMGPFEEMARSSQLVFLLPALGIFVYVALDNTDGLQARRIGLSSPLGDFMDHWLDGFSGFTVPLGIMVVLRVDDVRTLMVIVASVWAFWATNWDKKKSGVMKLPPLGDVEGNMVAVVIYVTTAVFGVSIWQSQVAGASVADALVALVFIGLTSATLRLILQNKNEQWQILGVNLSMLLVILWYRLALVSGVNGLRGHLLVPVLIGLIGAKHVGDLQRSHLIGTAYRAFDLSFVIIGAGLIATLYFGPAMLSFEIQLLLLSGFVLVVSGKLLYQFIHTSVFICRKLDIRLFSLTAAQKEALLTSEFSELTTSTD